MKNNNEIDFKNEHCPTFNFSTILYTCSERFSAFFFQLASHAGQKHRLTVHELYILCVSLASFSQRQQTATLARWESDEGRCFSPFRFSPLFHFFSSFFAPILQAFWASELLQRRCSETPLWNNELSQRIVPSDVYAYEGQFSLTCHNI